MSEIRRVPSGTKAQHHLNSEGITRRRFLGGSLIAAGVYVAEKTGYTGLLIDALPSAERSAGNLTTRRETEPPATVITAYVEEPGVERKGEKNGGKFTIEVGGKAVEIKIGELFWLENQYNIPTEVNQYFKFTGLVANIEFRGLPEGGVFSSTRYYIGERKEDLLATNHLFLPESGELNLPVHQRGKVFLRGETVVSEQAYIGSTSKEVVDAIRASNEQWDQLTPEEKNARPQQKRGKMLQNFVEVVSFTDPKRGQTHKIILQQDFDLGSKNMTTRLITTVEFKSIINKSGESLPE